MANEMMDGGFYGKPANADQRLAMFMEAAQKGILLMAVVHPDGTTNIISPMPGPMVAITLRQLANAYEDGLAGAFADEIAKDE